MAAMQPTLSLLFVVYLAGYNGVFSLKENAVDKSYLEKAIER